MKKTIRIIKETYNDKGKLLDDMAEELFFNNILRKICKNNALYGIDNRKAL